MPLPGVPRNTEIRAADSAEAAAWDPPSIPGVASPALQSQVGQGSAVKTQLNPLLIDVTPLSLSVEIVGGYCEKLIAANSPVPCDKTRTFLTTSDRQTAVCVNVAQGESARFRENTFLGQLELTGLEPKARGECAIAVTFEIDADGILNVRARDVATGREGQAKMRLTGVAEQDNLSAMLARQAQHEVH
jgi:molecular chaperone DnaK